MGRSFLLELLVTSKPVLIKQGFHVANPASLWRVELPPEFPHMLLKGLFSLTILRLGLCSHTSLPEAGLGLTLGCFPFPGKGDNWSRSGTFSTHPNHAPVCGRPASGVVP